MSLYTIDDGTAILKCKLWHNHDHDDYEAPAAITAHIDTNAVNMARSGTSRTNVLSSSLTQSSMKFGDLVSIHGKLDSFRGERQVNIRTWRVEVNCLLFIDDVMRDFHMYVSIVVL
jgi:hypothetical protein